MEERRWTWCSGIFSQWRSKGHVELSGFCLKVIFNLNKTYKKDECDKVLARCLPVVDAFGSASSSSSVQITNNTEALRKSWNPKFTLRSHFDSVRSLAFHPVEPLLVTASEDQTLKLWNLHKTAPTKKSVPRSSSAPCVTPPTQAAACMFKFNKLHINILCISNGMIFYRYTERLNVYLFNFLLFLGLSGIK